LYSGCKACNVQCSAKTQTGKLVSQGGNCPGLWFPSQACHSKPKPSAQSSAGKLVQNKNTTFAGDIAASKTKKQDHSGQTPLTLLSQQLHLQVLGSWD